MFNKCPSDEDAKEIPTTVGIFFFLYFKTLHTA